MKVLSILRYLGNGSHGNLECHIIDLIRNQFLNHPIKVISDGSMEIISQLLMTTKLLHEDVQSIMLAAPSIENRYNCYAYVHIQSTFTSMHVHV